MISFTPHPALLRLFFSFPFFARDQTRNRMRDTLRYYIIMYLMYYDDNM